VSTIRAVMCLAGCVVLAVAGAGASGREAAPALQPAETGVEPFPDPATEQRLRLLTPDRPDEYLRLAEEVAEDVEDPRRAELATRLYILAFELDRRDGRAGGIAASAALGLAAVERLDRNRRWLLALAGAIDRRYAQPDWNVAVATAVTEEQAYNAATVLGLARAGEGKEARRWLDKPGTAETLRRYERLIGTSGETGAMSRLEKYMQSWPCPECANERVVRKMGEKGPELRICPTCGGNPGPQLSEEELIGQLRFEAALLNGVQRSWAAQIIVDQGAPLRDPEPGELAATYSIDAGKPYWRGGRWVANAEGSPKR
jgi:hypothetical protein